MCRIAAIIGEHELKDQIFHLMLLYGSAQRYQEDGWGYTDGSYLRKHEAPFFDTGFVAEKMDRTKPWLGHVRSATVNTEISAEASHPYYFRNGDMSWFGVHNGYFDHIIQPDIKGPETDTFKAFYILNKLFYRDNPPKDRLFELLAERILPEWLSFFAQFTTFAVALHFGDTIYFMRAPSKELYVAQLDTLTLVHTSEVALNRILDYFQDYHNLGVPMNPMLLPENQLIRFEDYDAIMQQVNYNLYVRSRKAIKKKKGGR